MRRIVLGLVWLCVVSGFLVFTEPAPVDALTMGLVVLLPIVGLVSIRPVLVVYIAVWLLAAAGALIASTQSNEIDRSTIHSAISVYLYVSSFVFAAFVARSPLGHARLILRAYLAAALIAAGAGIVGYFDLLPGAADLLTRHARATGTFKDPNVFGPFLVPAAVYALHLTLTRRLRGAVLPAAALAVLLLAVLLSFSRGAWINLAFAVAVYGYLQFVTAPSNRLRLKLVALVLAGLAAGLGLVTAALQADSVAKLLDERAAMTQTYDEGPEGRFGGHEKAKRLIVDNPLDIGAAQFPGYHHHEDVHNVYLVMFLNAGWIGGLVFFLMMAATALLGLRHAFKRTASQPLFIVALSAFLGIVVEGTVIDVDHWRHLYLLMAILWGLIAADRRIVSASQLRALPASLVDWTAARPRRDPRILGEAITLSRPLRKRHRLPTIAPSHQAANVIRIDDPRLRALRRRRVPRRPPRILRRPHQ